MSRRVLVYNWAPYFRDPVVGGGVSVYCRNVLDAIADGSRGWAPSFLYAGYDYSPLPRAARIRRVRNDRHPDLPTFSLTDAPVPAPALLAFGDPDSAVAGAEVEELFAAFLREQGPFDVVHFHNLEGLNAACLRVAREAGARVVVTLHNYWSLCPQVQLWQDDCRPCTDDDGGRACATCLPIPADPERSIAHRRRHAGEVLVPGARAGVAVRAAAAVRFGRGVGATRPGGRRQPLRAAFDVEGATLPGRVAAYARRRPEIVGLLNRYADVVLAVSRRTAEIHVAYGLDPALVVTQPIGTTATELAPPPGNPAPYRPGERLRVAYLGESRRDKGFFFLLDELRRLPEAELRALDLTVACRVNDPGELRMAERGGGRLLTLAESLGRLRYVPGYRHGDLPALLDGVHVGVVPALWEDCLPQVALELLACRVPVLCSDRGGTREVVRDERFVFDPGVAGDLGARLRALREDPALLAAFWQRAAAPKPMAEHLPELLAVYAAS